MESGAQVDFSRARWRERLYIVIFEADTRAGRAFDLALLAFILISILAVMLETVPAIAASYGDPLRAAEWFFTIAFTAEYVVRLACVRSPLRYAVSFFGIVDLLAILPSYLSLLLPGAQSLLVIRSLRLLRVFRVLKLARFVANANMLMTALRSSRHKVIVFLGTVFILVVILGSAMYLIEGPERGFTSIPESVYWAIVTLTTVGYGDVTPHTVLGRVLASVVMMLGYAIIAVPTGIVTVEMSSAFRRPVSTQACPQCAAEGHAPDARFCRRCGASL